MAPDDPSRILAIYFYTGRKYIRSLSYLKKGIFKEEYLKSKPGEYAEIEFKDNERLVGFHGLTDGVDIKALGLVLCRTRF